MIIVGLTFLILWVGLYVDFCRREKDKEREYNLRFRGRYATNDEIFKK